MDERDGRLSMKVTVLLFAQLRLAAGVSRVELELPSGTLLEEALNEFDRRYPALAPMRTGCMTAVGLDYASSAAVVHDGDEISLIPPVQGG